MYIGQSINIEKRFKDHCYNSPSSVQYIDRSINKYGKNNFEFKILCECPEEKLDEEEKKFINLYGTYNQGYNLTKGGETSPAKDPNVAKKISESNRCRILSEETKRKISESKKGQVPWNKGKKCPQLQGENHHRYGKNMDIGSRLKIANNKTSTGIYRVIKETCKKCKFGFNYRYEYMVNGKRNRIRSVDIEKLEKRVKEKGLEWIILDYDLANKIFNESKELNEKRRKEHTTGYAHVIKHKDPSMTKGFIYRYTHFENNKQTHIESKSLQELKKRVVDNGWEWIKYNGNVDSEL